MSLQHAKNHPSFQGSGPSAGWQPAGGRQLPSLGRGRTEEGRQEWSTAPGLRFCKPADGERQEFPLPIKCGNVFLGSPLRPAWAPGHPFRRPSPGKATPTSARGSREPLKWRPPGSGRGQADDDHAEGSRASAGLAGLAAGPPGPTAGLPQRSARCHSFLPEGHNHRSYW